MLEIAEKRAQGLALQTDEREQSKRPSLVENLLVKLYGLPFGFARRLVLKILIRIEGPKYQYYSTTLRRIFAVHHGVEVGMYSHGACFVPRAFPSGTKIGRYCSLAVGAKAHGADHPMNLKSSHAFFFNPNLGIAKERLAVDQPLEIGNDVWLGDDAIILPAVNKIGDGAVVGAGSVVHKDIPSYGVVVGHPSRVVRYRFSKERIAQLLDERWWNRSIEDICDRSLDEFQTPIEADAIR